MVVVKLVYILLFFTVIMLIIPFGLSIDLRLGSGERRGTFLFWIINPNLAAGFSVGGITLQWSELPIKVKVKTRQALKPILTGLRLLTAGRWWKFMLNGSIGTGDPALTALLLASINTGFGLLAAKRIPVPMPVLPKHPARLRFKLTPCYHKRLVELNFQGILAFNMGNLLLTALKSLR